MFPVFLLSIFLKNEFEYKKRINKINNILHTPRIYCVLSLLTSLAAKRSLFSAFLTQIMQKTASNRGQVPKNIAVFHVPALFRSFFSVSEEIS